MIIHSKGCRKILLWVLFALFLPKSVISNSRICVSSEPNYFENSVAEIFERFNFQPGDSNAPSSVLEPVLEPTQINANLEQLDQISLQIATSMVQTGSIAIEQDSLKKAIEGNLWRFDIDPNKRQEFLEAHMADFMTEARTELPSALADSVKNSPLIPRGKVQQVLPLAKQDNWKQVVHYYRHRANPIDLTNAPIVIQDIRKEADGGMLTLAQPVSPEVQLNLSIPGSKKKLVVYAPVRGSDEFIPNILKRVYGAKIVIASSPDMARSAYLSAQRAALAHEIQHAYDLNTNPKIFNLATRMVDQEKVPNEIEKRKPELDRVLKEIQQTDEYRKWREKRGEDFKKENSSMAELAEKLSGKKQPELSLDEIRSKIDQQFKAQFYDGARQIMTYMLSTPEYRGWKEGIRYQVLEEGTSFEDIVKSANSFMYELSTSRSEVETFPGIGGQSLHPAYILVMRQIYDEVMTEKEAGSKK